jgi:hypothetical protein
VWRSLVAKRAYCWVGVHGFRTEIEGVLLHSISWWCRHGASHRKNFETPPLTWSCLSSNAFALIAKNLLECGNSLVSRPIH